jgi:hypothetical protein
VPRSFKYFNLLWCIHSISHISHVHAYMSAALTGRLAPIAGKRWTTTTAGQTARIGALQTVETTRSQTIPTSHRATLPLTTPQPWASPAKSGCASMSSKTAWLSTSLLNGYAHSHQSLRYWLDMHRVPRVCAVECIVCRIARPCCCVHCCIELAQIMLQAIGSIDSPKGPNAMRTKQL